MNCRDRCGRTARDEEAACAAGWTHCAIAGGWRCGTCDAELFAASSIIGMGDNIPDTLPLASRGALPKETASTITPPSRGIAP